MRAALAWQPCPGVSRRATRPEPMSLCFVSHTTNHHLPQEEEWVDWVPQATQPRIYYLRRPRGVSFARALSPSLFTRGHEPTLVRPPVGPTIAFFFSGLGSPFHMKMAGPTPVLRRNSTFFRFPVLFSHRRRFPHSFRHPFPNILSWGHVSWSPEQVLGPTSLSPDYTDN